jgi:hypothetical protein
MRRQSWLAVALVLLAAASADARGFKVYSYSTPDQGESELVLWWDMVLDSDAPYPYFGETLEKDGLQRYSLEAEYGVTDRWTLAAYADFDKPRGGAFEYVQARAVVTRYRFFEQGERFLDGAIYFEYYLPYHKYAESEHLETRVILQKDVALWSFILNPLFDKNVSGEVDEGLELEYAAAIYYRIARGVTPGLEFYGELGPLSNLKPGDAQAHYVFPRVAVKLGPRMAVDAGLGFGLTDASDDLVVKVLLEFEP